MAKTEKIDIVYTEENNFKMGLIAIYSFIVTNSTSQPFWLNFGYLNCVG